jgi:hypothetical protein
LGVPTLPNWLIDEAGAVVCDNKNVDLMMLFNVVEIARWTVEVERLPKSSLS